METVYLIIGGIVATLAAVWGIFRTGKKSGTDAAQSERQRTTIEQERKANEANIKANNAANSATDDDNRDWLLNNARRKRNDTD